MTQSFQAGWLPPVICPQCGAELSPALLACPGCRRLVHGEKLNNLAAEARTAEEANDVTTALQKWRDALDLLPPNSRQHATIVAKVSDLSRRVDAGAGSSPVSNTLRSPAHPKHGSSVGKALGVGGAVALLLWKFKFVLGFVLTKGKLLLLGLTKGSTFFTMLLSLGVYWTAWGWKFALGLVLSIYIHEMGHVAALMRYGMKATAPMFLPGLGAMIRLQQRPADPREDARIGLAGPLWGLGAAAGAYAVSLYTGWPSWAAIAKVGAWVNLFNLAPVWQLDGSRAFRALVRRQRWTVLAACGVMFYFTHEGLLALIGVIGVIRTLAEKNESTAEGDKVTLYQFLFLVLMLSVMTLIPVQLGPP